MSSGRPSSKSIVAGLLTIYLVWGSTYLAIRLAVETLPPFFMAGTRFLIAGLILATYLKLTRKFSVNRAQLMQGAVIGAFLLLGGNGLVCWAEQKVPSGITTLVISLNPLFTVIGDWVVFYRSNESNRGSKPTKLIFVGITLGLVGLILLVGPAITARDSSQLDATRMLAVVAGCMFWCIGSLMSRYFKEPAPPACGAAVQMIFGGAWLLGASLLLGEPSQFDPKFVSFSSAAAWLYLVVFGSLIGFTTFAWLMTHVTPALVSTHAYVNPIVAVFLGWLILNEAVDSRIFAAAAVIVLGVALISISRSRQASARMISSKA